MRILVWSDHFWPHIGGIEVRAAHILAALCRQGHEGTVITDRHPADLPASECWRGMTIHRVELTKTLEGRDLRSLRRLCHEIRELKRSFRPDVEVVYVWGPCFMIQQMVNRGEAVPTICSIQAAPDLLLELAGKLPEMLLRSAAVLAVSEFVRRDMCEAIPELAGRIQLLRSCLPMPELAPTPLPMDPPVILCLGTLARHKGVDLALRALSRLDGRWSEVRMIIAGDGPERSALEALAAELGLARRVTFTGWVNPPEVPALINQATLLLMPARWQEAFAGVNLQAAQMGRPVVASRVGGNPEGVLDGETGLLVDNEDDEAMAEAMAVLLADPGRMEAMGNRGRQRMKEEYGFDPYIEKHLELFRRHAKTSEEGA